MSKKNAIRLLSFALAAVLALGVYSYVDHRALVKNRSAAVHSSQLAFEETVTAVCSLSAQLEKCPYVTDSSMRGRLCAGICADARAAEAALATLPFTTHELESISGYINRMGDYAFTLCSNAGESFDDGQRQTLRDMSKLASQMADSLQELQHSVHDGSILIDGSDESLINIGQDHNSYISREFLRFEEEFPQYDSPDYDGQYGRELQSESGRKRSDAEMLAMAAGAVEASPSEMRLNYEYEDGQGRKCYSHGDTLVCVGPRGVESMSQSRLVGEENISGDEARKAAESYLEKQGYKELTLSRYGSMGGLAVFRYISEKDGILYPCNALDVSVALDDGSIYSFSAVNYSSQLPKAEWSISAAAAAKALPEGVEAGESRKLMLQSAGGENVPCYSFECTGSEGEELVIYVNAQSGRQQEIEIL